METSGESMTEKEIFIKNNILMGEFTRYMVEHPKFAARVSKGARVVLLPKDDPELCEFNKRVAHEHLEKGQEVVYIHIEKLAPAKSRLVRPHLEKEGVKSQQTS